MNFVIFNTCKCHKSPKRQTDGTWTLRSLFSVAVVIIFSISYTEVDLQFYTDQDTFLLWHKYKKKFLKGEQADVLGMFFSLLCHLGDDGLQEICHIAHTCCVVLYGWIPTSGPKSKQYTIDIQKKI